MLALRPGLADGSVRPGHGASAARQSCRSVQHDRDDGRGWLVDERIDDEAEVRRHVPGVRVEPDRRAAADRTDAGPPTGRSEHPWSAPPRPSGRCRATGNRSRCRRATTAPSRRHRPTSPAWRQVREKRSAYTSIRPVSFEEYTNQSADGAMRPCVWMKAASRSARR